MAVIPVLSVIWCPNPMRPASDREYKAVALQEGDTVQSVIERLGLVDTPLAALLNGQQLDPARWSATTVQAADVLVLQQVARYVAGATVAAKLVEAGMAVGAAVAVGAVLAFAANVVISIALSAVAASLMKKGGGSSGQDADKAPTAYSIEGGSNDSRPYEPLPLVLGEHRVFPDYASRPFGEFVPDPTAVQEVVNNTPMMEVRLHPPFELDETGKPAAPWTQLTGFIGGDGDYTYYGDNAERTFTLPNGGGTATRPHTFVVRCYSGLIWNPGASPEVTTYEDWGASLQSSFERG